MSKFEAKIKELLKKDAALRETLREAQQAEAQAVREKWDEAMAKIQQALGKTRLGLKKLPHLLEVSSDGECIATAGYDDADHSCADGSVIKAVGVFLTCSGKGFNAFLRTKTGDIKDATWEYMGFKTNHAQEDQRREPYALTYNLQRAFQTIDKVTTHLKAVPIPDYVETYKEMLVEYLEERLKG